MTFCMSTTSGTFLLTGLWIIFLTRIDLLWIKILAIMVDVEAAAFV